MMRRWVVGSLAIAAMAAYGPNESFAQRGGRRGGGVGGPSPGGARPAQSPTRSAAKLAGADVARQPGGAGLDRPSTATPRNGVQPANTGDLNSFLNGGRTKADELDRANAAERSANASQFKSDAEPFTAAWYKDHPNAFHAAYPHADAWAAATTVGLAAWLAVPAVPVTVSGNTAAVTSEPAAESAIPAESATDAAALADAGNAPVPENSEWMQIGVFSLSSGREAEPTRMIQLAVNKEGILRGTHLDLISNAADSIQGSVDKKSLQAAWTVGKDGQVVFEAPLGDMTSETARAIAYFPNRKSLEWILRQAKNSNVHVSASK